MSAVPIEPMPQDNEAVRQLAEAVVLYTGRPARRPPDQNVLDQLTIAAADVVKGLAP